MFVALVHASIALPASSTAGAAVAAAAASSLGARVRSDFKLLDQDIWEGKRLVYLDSAATSQKPASVVRAMTEHLERDNANVHRGAHSLATRSTASYESARDKVAAFVGAAD
jgi:cysteine desulfurase/selenocysteine lyase